MSASKLVHTETYNRDGIDYQIRVVQQEGGLWGEWTCSKCGQSGGSSAKDPSVEIAVISGKVNLGLHHAMVHVIQGDSPRKAAK